MSTGGAVDHNASSGAPGVSSARRQEIERLKASLLTVPLPCASVKTSRVSISSESGSGSSDSGTSTGGGARGGSASGGEEEVASASASAPRPVTTTSVSPGRPPISVSLDFSDDERGRQGDEAGGDAKDGDNDDDASVATTEGADEGVFCPPRPRFRLHALVFMAGRTRLAHLLRLCMFPALVCVLLLHIFTLQR